ncbi:MAG: hypothetical protein HC855_13045 [Rhizobiales bacterium]|nr:hypothetical protein [Hyphomicrobiales bacterium]
MKRTSPAQAREFALEKYRHDRRHEVELNKATLQYELESLRILSYLNGGAAALYLGLVSSLAKQSAALDLACHAAPVVAWAIGLFAAALAIWQMYEAQVGYTQAYHRRRRAEEKRRLEGHQAYVTVTDPKKTAEQYDEWASEAAGKANRNKSYAKMFALASVLMFCAGLLTALMALTTR